MRRRSPRGGEALRDWCRIWGTHTAYTDPGSPWETLFIESFNGRLRGADGSGRWLCCGRPGADEELDGLALGEGGDQLEFASGGADERAERRQSLSMSCLFHAVSYFDFLCRLSLRRRAGRAGSEAPLPRGEAPLRAALWPLRPSSTRVMGTGSPVDVSDGAVVSDQTSGHG